MIPLDEGYQERKVSMKCPFCGEIDTRVLESRQTEEGQSIRRRRECVKCGERFTTYERVEKRQLFVIKKDGRREVFDSGKILRGVIKACEKRPVSVEEIHVIVNDVESQLANSMECEVPSSLIGEMVMDKLKVVDDVAYVRFASVYREFADINMFMEEMETLIQKKDNTQS